LYLEDLEQKQNIKYLIGNFWILIRE
jgi:hypothetical protein